MFKKNTYMYRLSYLINHIFHAVTNNTVGIIRQHVTTDQIYSKIISTSFLKFEHWRYKAVIPKPFLT